MDTCVFVVCLTKDLDLKRIQVIVPLANTAKGSLEEDPFLVVHPNYCYSDV